MGGCASVVVLARKAVDRSGAVKARVAKRRGWSTGETMRTPSLGLGLLAALEARATVNWLPRSSARGRIAGSRRCPQGLFSSS